jgi:DNA binding domain, excisionase family
MSEKEIDKRLERMERRLERLEKTLSGLEEGAPDARTMLTADEAARVLGISRATLLKMTSARQIPFYKPNGKNLYFDRGELDAWLRRNRQGPEGN